MHLTSIEWCNKADTFPFQIRYLDEVPLLTYRHNDPKANMPFTSLISNVNSLGNLYPILFENPRAVDNCICYNVNKGETSKGF